ncbi:MAG: dihydroneopterin aldolase [Maribacter sp.]|nr:dihydroneopterin aldolase [Maribacter sp.]
MGKIQVKNIRVYANHGCLKEETLIGSEYRVDVSVKADLKKASITDNLSHTVDYVRINHIVKEEMKIPSKLLEQVAHRILQRVFDEVPIAWRAKVRVSKINPPIGGDVEMVSINLAYDRPENA